MQFTGDDLKILLEVMGPMLAGLWYLRGTLVKLDVTLTSLGGRVTKVETDVEDLQGWRLQYVENHAAHSALPRSPR
jgi:hypothetical protein